MSFTINWDDNLIWLSVLYDIAFPHEYMCIYLASRKYTFLEWKADYQKIFHT